PEDDANAWLQSGATAEDVQQLMQNAPTWLDIIVDRVMQSGKPAEFDLKQVFMAITQLDTFQLAQVKTEICSKLNLPVRTFQHLLRAVQGLQAAGADQTSKYNVVDGSICRKVTDADGSLHFSPLCNFAARIVRDCVTDDGMQEKRYLTLTGKLAAGRELPPIKIPAEGYNRMDWVLEYWGVEPLINVGYTTRDHMRCAIQELSTEVDQVTEYTHMGWREIDGQQVYITGNGAVGVEGIRTHMPPDLQAYHLPAASQAERKQGALASMRFWDVGDLGVTVPLWALMYLAPLTSLLKPAFTLWLYGSTGTMKSTLTALAMNHYGNFSYDTPTTSWSSTEFALRRLSFLAKDAVLWVDDYTLIPTATGRHEMHRKASILLRDWGNRTMRSAGQRDGTLRDVNYLRGLVVTTAELLPAEVSIRARLVTVHMEPGMVVGGAGSALTRAQVEDASFYASAMAGYIQWLAKDWSKLDAQLHRLLRDQLALTRTRLDHHPRGAMNTAMLCCGLEMGLRYLLATGVIDEQAYAGRITAGRDVLIANARVQDTEINQEYDSVALYLDALENLLTQGTCHLRSKQHPDVESRVRPQMRSANSTLLGWYDDDHWYLLPAIAYQMVYQFYRLSGVLFPDTEYGIRTKLQERGLIAMSNEGRITYRLRINGQRRCLLVIPSSWREHTNGD
ncbi:MAG: DUF927 domain-containing protein, partial [Anaerolineae bacterium]|nr:DUF927 domain-containing protein [Anaerolineae bacterium]